MSTAHHAHPIPRHRQPTIRHRRRPTTSTALATTHLHIGRTRSGRRRDRHRVDIPLRPMPTTARTHPILHHSSTGEQYDVTVEPRRPRPRPIGRRRPLHLIQHRIPLHPPSARGSDPLLDGRTETNARCGTPPIPRRQTAEGSATTSPPRSHLTFNAVTEPMPPQRLRLERPLNPDTTPITAPWSPSMDSARTQPDTVTGNHHRPPAQPTTPAPTASGDNPNVSWLAPGCCRRCRCDGCRPSVTRPATCVTARTEPIRRPIRQTRCRQRRHICQSGPHADTHGPSGDVAAAPHGGAKPPVPRRLRRRLDPHSATVPSQHRHELRGGDAGARHEHRRAVVAPLNHSHPSRSARTERPQRRRLHRHRHLNSDVTVTVTHTACGPAHRYATAAATHTP